MESSREKIGKILGCSPKEIYFTSGGSESDNQAIISAARLGEKTGKKHIVTSSFEHPAVYKTMEYLKGEGFDITYLDVYENGVVVPKDVENAIREDTCLVSIMYVNNEIGTIQPIEEIGKICRKKGVLFHTDAVQAAGQIDINVERDFVDMLSISAHKFHGPKGVGALYVRRGVEPAKLILGGGQERGKRAGTENVAGVVGMAAALEESVRDLKAKQHDLSSKRDRLINALETIEGAYLNGDRLLRNPGTVNFSFDGILGETLLMKLDSLGIIASSGSACSAGSLEPSHVVTALGRNEKLAMGSLRLSMGYDITDEEVDYLIKGVRDSVLKLREKRNS